MFVHVRAVNEAWPGDKWSAFFERAWPLYRSWFVSEGEHKRADVGTSVAQLTKHMPELLPVFNALSALSPDDEMTRRFLSMWCPPPYMGGCSLAVTQTGNATLVRNYDYDPRYFDGRLVRTEFCKPVIGMQDSAWGLLDGMNADGLAVALAFGGRDVSGTGFGVPLLVRYILETCETVKEACEVMARVPLHMAYTIMVLDRSGAHATAFLSPDRPAQFVQQRAATNHQVRVEWDEYAALTRSVMRKNALDEYVADKSLRARDLIDRFLKAPLYSQRFFDGFGTLYTAAYDVARKKLRLVWPEKRMEVSFDVFEEQEAKITLLRPVGRYLAK